MAVLGLSQKSFKINKPNRFKVYGDGLSNAVPKTLTTTASNITWTNISMNGNGQNHVEMTGTPSQSRGDAKDTTGDLTVTVTDNSVSPAQDVVQTFTPVTYTAT